MRKLRSLGYQSDLLVLSLAGEERCSIIDHGDVIQAITPHNPTYYWGNLVLFPNPPAVGDIERWEARYWELFSGHPEVRHISIGWDDTSGAVGEVQPFLDAGYKLETLSVMSVTADALSLPKREVSGLKVRPLVSDADWNAATELQVLCGLEEFTREEYETFKQRQMKQFRMNSEAGKGHWYGAFLGEELVGDLGIFHGESVGRFQSVETHPEHRRKGIASQLVYQSSLHAFAHFPSISLVIVAHEGAPAMIMYEGVGYRTTEAQVALCKAPEKVLGIAS